MRMRDRREAQGSEEDPYGAYPASGGRPAVRNAGKQVAGDRLSVTPAELKIVYGEGRRASSVGGDSFTMSLTGDLTDGGLPDADQKHVYERTAANGPWILEVGISDLQGTELPGGFAEIYGYLQRGGGGDWKGQQLRAFQMENGRELVVYDEKCPCRRNLSGFMDEALDEAFRVVKE